MSCFMIFSFNFRYKNLLLLSHYKGRFYVLIGLFVFLSVRMRQNAFRPFSQKFIKSIKFIRFMDPSGRFVHGSIAAGKPCPKDARYFMNFINFRS